MGRQNRYIRRWPPSAAECKLGNDFAYIITKDDSDYSLGNLRVFITLLASDISENISSNDDIGYNVRMKAKKSLKRTK